MRGKPLSPENTTAKDKEKDDKEFPDDEIFDDMDEISNEMKEREEKNARILAWYIEESDRNKDIATVASKNML